MAKIEKELGDKHNVSENISHLIKFNHVLIFCLAGDWLVLVSS